MEKYLLNFKWRIPGHIMLVSGLILAGIYFLLNPRLEAPVFAVLSSYMEVKTFAVFRTNIFDELVLLSLLTGLFLIVFSKEKNEKEEYSAARSKALSLSVIINFILICFSVLFVFGSSFLGFLVINIYLLPIIYLIIFNILKYRLSRI